MPAYDSSFNPPAPVANVGCLADGAMCLGRAIHRAGAETNKPNREEQAMTSTLQSRRDLLKGVVASAAAVWIGTTTVSRRAAAQGATQPRPQIDGILRQA